MKLWSLAALVPMLAVSAAYADLAPARPPRPEPQEPAIVVALRSAVKCDSVAEMKRAWCPALEFAKAGYRSPRETEVYLGITVVVPKGKDLGVALQSNLSLSTLVAGPGKILVRALTPSNADERKQLLRVAESVMGAITRGETPIHVEADLDSYLRGQKADLAKTGRPIADSPKPAAYKATNPSHVALVEYARLPAIAKGKPNGRAYVVIEEAPDGTWLNVFPVAPFGTQ